MRVTRQFSTFVQYVLDQWVPPIVRDSRWFMWLPMKLLFRDHVNDFMDFKRKAFSMTEDEFSDVYRRTSHLTQIQGETDLNQSCIDEILKSLAEGTVLEVGAGRGYLADLMATTHSVTGSDILVKDDVRARFPEVEFVEASMEDLPFPDDSFDTVVTTHTLEHVQHLNKAVSELRRVARKRLIIVVPKQRPYLYNFSLHINFFPYDWSLVGQFGHRPDSQVKDLGDWFYIEMNPHNEP